MTYDRRQPLHTMALVSLLRLLSQGFLFCLASSCATRTHIHELLNHKDKTHQDTGNPGFCRGMLRTNPANA